MFDSKQSTAASHFQSAQRSHFDRRTAANAASSIEKAENLCVEDPKCSRGFTYTMYEANAWQLKFAKSGMCTTMSP